MKVNNKKKKKKKYITGIIKHKCIDASCRQEYNCTLCVIPHPANSFCNYFLLLFLCSPDKLQMTIQVVKN